MGDRARRDYEKLKGKLAADPEYARERREAVLRRQRARIQNPEARRRHRLACASWRDRKARGITERKTQTTYNRIESPQFRDAPFQITFND
jgi:hypothetical protein